MIDTTITIVPTINKGELVKSLLSSCSLFLEKFKNEASTNITPMINVIVLIIVIAPFKKIYYNYIILK